MATFTITIEAEFELGEAELWPNDDVPDSPTVADVIAVMQKDGRNEADLIRKWNLGDDFTISVNGERVEL